MKLTDMRNNFRYTVVTGSICDTFQKGDQLTLDDENVVLSNYGAFISRDDILYMTEVELELDVDWAVGEVEESCRYAKTLLQGVIEVAGARDKRVREVLTKLRALRGINRTKH